MNPETAVAPETADPAPRRFAVGVKDVLCIGPIVIHLIYGYAGFPLNAMIGTNPVLVSALRGSTASIVAAGAFARVGRAPLALVLLAPLLISVLFDPFYFWAGRRYGRTVLDYIAANDPRSRKRLARGERLFRRFGVGAVLVAPNAGLSQVVGLLAGEAGMRFSVFFAADIIGNQIANSLIVALGFAIGQPAVSVAETVSHYALWILIGTLVLVVGWSVFSAMRAPVEDSPKP